jgi:hypothetical protein
VAASTTAITATIRRKREAVLDQLIEENVMQDKKTHEQQLRILENKEDMPDARRRKPPAEQAHIADRNTRESEFAISRGGVNQESDHNKHNDEGQHGHKPQQHSPAEEKH